VTILRLSYDTS